MEYAEEEIERTAQEAVKAVLIEVGGELEYQNERADLLETKNTELQLELSRTNEKLRKADEKVFWSTLIGTTGGIIVTSLIFTLISGIAR